MDLKQYIDSTYLKTPEQAGLTPDENISIVKQFIQESIDEKYKLVMLRPDCVPLASNMIANQNSKVLVGTVISFPEGTNTLEEKEFEIKQAILDGAHEIDIVSNYEKFKNGEIAAVKNEIFYLTKLVLDNHKIVKWIIETAALTDSQIIQFCALIKNVVITHFKEENFVNVFVKSSTGFYKSSNNKPAGATIQSIVLMLENASPLSVKASGGIKNSKDAIIFINLGVKRIGTSAAKAIIDGQTIDTNY